MALIKWTNRYSKTMEDDEVGRWARVAFAGKSENFGFFRGKVCRWEIAWIKKLKTKKQNRFQVIYNYPSNGKLVFDDVESAKAEVKKTFSWFVKMCAS
ncbi:MAG: hypothetical protein IM631_12790 [Cytophagales bacterium]|nr:hypothetical protein [Cytophagales bacterium]MCA6382394.1 hypothetical protein [Cytophagales bacterium]